MESLNANELRIGNLIQCNINDGYADRIPYYGKNIYQVKVIMDDSIKIDLGFEATQRVLMDDPKLKPVPITEEWIRKEKNIIKRQENLYQLYGFYISTQHEILLHLTDNIEPVIELKSVHQWQNVIFALTKKELEFK